MERLVVLLIMTMMYENPENLPSNWWHERFPDERCLNAERHGLKDPRRWNLSSSSKMLLHNSEKSKSSDALLPNQISSNHRSLLFTLLDHLVLDNLKQRDPTKREGAALALGMMASVGTPSSAPHLPQAVPFLVSFLHDAESAVRKAACWCLARYPQWTIHSQPPWFGSLLQGLLSCMRDADKGFRLDCARLFATFAKGAGGKLDMWLEPVLRQIVACFPIYRVIDFDMLCDCIHGTLIGAGSDADHSHSTSIFVPTLMFRWSVVEDTSSEMLSLLRCFRAIGFAHPKAFPPIAKTILPRCVGIGSSQLRSCLDGPLDSYSFGPSKDLLVEILNLFTVSAYALPNSVFISLVSSAEASFSNFLSRCIVDCDPEVRLCAYSLLHDRLNSADELLHPQPSDPLPCPPDMSFNH